MHDRFLFRGISHGIEHTDKQLTEHEISDDLVRECQTSLGIIPLEDGSQRKMPAEQIMYTQMSNGSVKKGCTSLPGNI